MRFWPNVVVGAVALACLAPGVILPAAEPAREWVSMLQGDFAGWQVYLRDSELGADPQRVFQLVDGVLHVYRDAADGAAAPFGYLATDREYSHYHLKLDYRWGHKRFAPRAEAKRDCGVLYHVVGPDHVWPRSIECQIQEHDTGDIWALGGVRLTTTFDPQAIEPTYHPAGVSRVNVLDRVVKTSTHDRLDDWNTVEVIVQGDSFTHVVNGQVVARGVQTRQPDPTQPGRMLPLSAGRIALQAEGAEVLYRRVMLRELPTNAPTPKDLPARLADPAAPAAPLPVGPDAEGIWRLLASRGAVRGPSLRIHPRRDVATDWMGVEDRLIWQVREAPAGPYDVYVTYGVPDSAAGQKFVCEIDGEVRFDDRWRSTGGFEQLETRQIDRLELAGGTHEIALRPFETAREGMAHVQTLWLVPAHR